MHAAARLYQPEKTVQPRMTSRSSEKLSCTGIFVLLLMLASFSSAQLTFAKQASSCIAIDYPIPENIIVKRILLVPGAQPAVYYDANTQYVSALALGSIPHAAVPQRYGVLPEENETYAPLLAEVYAANAKVEQAKRDALLAGDASVVAHCRLLCALTCPRFCDVVQVGSAATRAAAAKRSLQASKDSLAHAISAARASLKLVSDAAQALEQAGAANYTGFASGVYAELAEADNDFKGGASVYATACARAKDLAAAFGASYYNKTALSFAERNEFSLLFNSLVEDSAKSVVGSAIALHKRLAEALRSMERDYTLALQDAEEALWAVEAKHKAMRDERYDAVDDATLAFVRSQSQYAPQLQISAAAPLAASPRQRMHDVETRISDAKALVQNAKQVHDGKGDGYTAKAISKLGDALDALREAGGVADATAAAMAAALASSESLAREKRDDAADALQRFAPSGSIILLNDANALYREAEALLQRSRDAYATGEKISYNAEALRRFMRITEMLSNPQDALASLRFGAKEALERLREALSLAAQDGIEAPEHLLLRELDEAYAVALKHEEFYNFNVIISQAAAGEKSLRKRALEARAPLMEKLRRDALALQAQLADAGYGDGDTRAALQRWDAYFDAGELRDALGSYNIMEDAYRDALKRMHDYAKQHIEEIMSKTALVDVDFSAPRIDEETTARVAMRFTAPLSLSEPLSVRVELPQYLSGFNTATAFLSLPTAGASSPSIAGATVGNGAVSLRFTGVKQGDSYIALFNATGVIAKTLSKTETTVLADASELRRRIDVRYASSAELPSLGAALALSSPAVRLNAYDADGALAAQQYRVGSKTYADVLLTGVRRGEAAFSLEYSLPEPVSIARSAIVSERISDASYNNRFDVEIRNNLGQALDGFPIVLLQDADGASAVQVVALDAVQPRAVSYESAASVLSLRFSVTLQPLQSARFRVAYATRSQAPVQAAANADDAGFAALEAELAQMRALAEAAARAMRTAENASAQPGALASGAANASAQQMLSQMNWSDAMGEVLDAKGAALLEAGNAAEALAARKANLSAQIVMLGNVARMYAGVANVSAITDALGAAASELEGVSYDAEGAKRIEAAEALVAGASEALALLPDSVVAELNSSFDGFDARRAAALALLGNHALATSFTLADDALKKHAKKFAAFSTDASEKAGAVLSRLGEMRGWLSGRSAMQLLTERPSLRGDIGDAFAQLALLETRMRAEIKKAASDANASLETARLAVAQASKILPEQKQLDSYVTTASKNYAEGRYVNSLVASDYAYSRVQDALAAQYESKKARETNVLYAALPVLFFAALLVMFLRRGKHKPRVIPNDEP